MLAAQGDDEPDTTPAVIPPAIWRRNVRRADLPDSTKVYAEWLADRRIGRTDTYRGGQQAAAEQLATSLRTIKRAEARLIADGYLVRVERGCRRRSNSVFVLRFPDPKGATAVTFQEGLKGASSETVLDPPKGATGVTLFDKGSATRTTAPLGDPPFAHADSAGAVAAPVANARLKDGERDRRFLESQSTAAAAHHDTQPPAPATGPDSTTLEVARGEIATPGLRARRESATLAVAEGPRGRPLLHVDGNPAVD